MLSFLLICPLLDLMGIFDGDAVKPNWLLLEISTLYIPRKYLNKTDKALACASQKKAPSVGTEFSSPYMVIVTWEYLGTNPQSSFPLCHCSAKTGEKRRENKENPVCRKWLLFVTRLGIKENNTERKF